MSEEQRVHDPLLECLSIICHLHEKHFSATAATAGLPLEKGKLTPSLFIRAAETVGFSTKIHERSLKKISKLVMPVVLILKDNNACVVKRRLSGDNYEVVFPDSGGVSKVSSKDLEKEYGGYIIIVQPQFEFEHRTEEMEPIEPRSWFWGTILSYKRIYIHVFIAAFLTNLFVLVAPLFIMNVYDRVVPNHAISTLWVLAVGAFIFFAFDLMARLMRHYLVELAGRKADEKLSGILFKQLLGLRMSNKPESTGTVASYFSEFEALREFYTSATFIGLIDIPFIVLFLLVIWIIGGPIVLVPLIAVPLVLSLAFILEIPTRRAIQNALAGSAFRQAVLVESLNGLESLKTIGAESQVQRKWENVVHHTGEAASQSRFYSAITMNVTVWIQQLVVIGVVILGVYEISAGELTVGGLIAVTILSGRALMLGHIASLLSRIERSRTALRGLNRLMSLATDRSVKKIFLRRPKIKGDITIENLTFYYPNQRVAAIDDLSLSIKAGERVGIVGRIGSGKSTLLKILDGLYTPTSGSVMIDGTDNTDIDPTDLRRNVIYVADDSVLFYGTVRDNILMAKPHATDEELLRACQIAGVDKFVNRHPAGYDMQVGERGQLLSSGQRQAVFLARGLITNPQILLLDEPTSAVDNNFEQEFMEALPEMLENKTLVIVTHRSSLLAMVDRVIVLEAGRMVADGPTKMILEKLTQTHSKSPGPH